METQSIKLNLIPNYASFPEVIKLKQYDKTDTSNGKSIVFNVYNGDSAYSIPSTATVTVRGTKADNTGYEYECEYSGNVVTCKIQSQMTIYSGKYDAELRISSGNNIVGSASFKIDVQPSALSDDTTISDTELPLLEKAIESAEKVVDLEKKIDSKQDQLVSGTNIKTVNSQSLLGSGNITISTGTTSYTALTNKPVINGTTLTGSRTLVATINGSSPSSTGAITINTVPTDATNIATNTSDISALKTSVATNTSDISALKTSVATNTTNIATNTTNIASVKSGNFVIDGVTVKLSITES